MAQPPAPPGPKPAPVYQPAFTAGVLDPKLWFRSDLAKWRSGLAQAQNFFVHVQGGASNRPGTEYIGTVKDSTKAAKLIPFVFNDTQTYVLEVGEKYIRFISNGAYLTNTDGSAYEVATPYLIGDVFNLRWTQSNDVLTFAHPVYPVYNLNRLGALNWTFTAETYTEGLAAPVLIQASADGSSGSRAVNGNAGATGTTPGISSVVYSYAVTSVSNELATESLISGAEGITNYNIGYYQQYGNYNIIEWNAVAGADYYKVYRMFQGVWSFIGSTTGTTFDDYNIGPDTTTGPPQQRNPFAGNNYPGCVTYYQQRKVFAGSTEYPQTIWCSKSGNYTNMDVSNPVRDDDAITATIASNQSNLIHHLVSLSDLIVMTSTSSWKVSAGSQASALSPSAFVATPQVFSGVYAGVQPLVIEYDILYVEAKGSKIRALNYNFYAAIYTSTDVSALAEGLFYGFTIVDWCNARAPFDLVWAIRSDGTLLGLTYLKEQDVYAWHQHSTAGLFKSCAVVSETLTDAGVAEDAVYFTVQRTINGQPQVFVERLHTRLLGPENLTLSKAWFVDSGLEYDGTEPVMTVSGLSHLVGEAVTGIADGTTLPMLTVSAGGTVTLPKAATRIILGLPYTATLQTLPIDVGQPSIVGKRKRISRVYAMLQNTIGATVSTDGVQFNPLEDVWATEATLQSTGIGVAVRQVLIPPTWDEYGQITIQQTQPQPCTVLGIDAELTVGQS
jgi:hypothetical protein